MNIVGMAGAQPKPEGTMTWGLHFTIAPTFFDPAEASGLATPFMFLYALHDALIKPMPAGLLTPSLAEAWTESPDGLVYDFKLREGVTFHNGQRLAASDVVFSFKRYRGASKKVFEEKVEAVEALDPHRVRVRLREPWPDFLLFLGTPATGAGLVVPQKYLEQVGNAEAVANDLGAVGIKLRVRTMERPTMITAWRAKTLQGAILAISGALSSAAARLENYVASWGEFAYGGSPDLDALFHKQARELDRQRREELLHEMQRLVHDRVMFVPIHESTGITGIGPRVAESGLGLITPYQWSGPYEDVRRNP
jgi:ABC-type transport system substrate-binding protein